MTEPSIQTTASDQTTDVTPSQSSLDRILAGLGIRPIEQRLMAMLFGNMFLSGLAIGVTRVCAFTLFLKYFASEQLAVIAIALAVTGTLITLFIERTTQQFSVKAYLFTLLGTIFFGLIAVRLLLHSQTSELLIFSLPLFFEIVYMLFSLQFIALITRLLNVRQTKRLAGIARSGEFLAELVGGLSIAILLNYMALADLLMVAAIAVLGVMTVVQITINNFGDVLNQSHVNKQAKRDDISGNSRTVFAMPYVKMIVLCYTTFIFAYFFLDVAFYKYAVQQFPAGKDLATFIGQFFAIVGLLTMLTMVFAFAPFIRKFGILASIIAFPTIVGIGVFSISALEFSHASTNLIFVVMVITNGLRFVLQSAIWRPSVSILFQVLPNKQRTRGTALIEGIVDPLAGGLAGVSLFIFSEYLHWQPKVFLLLLGGLMLVWIFVGVLIRKNYLSKLLLSIQQRKLGDINTEQLDDASMKIILRGLDSPIVTDVFYCLNVLEKLEHANMPKLIERTLANAAEDVRIDVLKRIERLQLKTLGPQVYQRIIIEDNHHVLSQALRTYGALQPDNTTRILGPFLTHDYPNIRQGALIGILTFDPTEDDALTYLLNLVRSNNVINRIQAADAMGEIGSEKFSGFLIELFDDAELEVVDKAIIAAGESKDNRLVNKLISKISNKALRGRAGLALQRLGTLSLRELDLAIAAPTYSRQEKYKMIEVVREIGGENATIILLKHIDIEQPELKHQIYIGLAQAHYQAEKDDHYIFANKLHEEVAIMTWILATMRDLHDVEKYQHVHAALGSELDIHRDNIFLLTSFIYSSFIMLDSRAHIDSKISDLRVFAIEVLDNVLNTELKEVIIPLLDDLTVAERLEKMSKFFPQTKMTVDQRFDDIINNHTDDVFAWSKSCLLHVVGEQTLYKYQHFIQAALNNPEPIIRETALWAWAQLEPKNLHRTLKAHADDEDASVRILVNHLLATTN